MKKVIVKCNQCGYEERIELYSREEAEKGRIKIVPPRCSKCGSPNVKIYE
jgi:formate dehydrogenase maturation protein FdhE